MSVVINFDKNYIKLFKITRYFFTTHNPFVEHVSFQINVFFTKLSVKVLFHTLASKPCESSMHVPLFRHGLEEQNLLSTWQDGPTLIKIIQVKGGMYSKLVNVTSSPTLHIF
ncbi:hypothetical protein BpHYR1_029950 [Brachionus plicatilis]|uniref:Uncharacterized protein n=1 Tax=Brachionus plicatilis TaxID=10195 RepID=A0A3M7QC41_BRAPC|nr:hypothetical protein BpHYR1_029950 [Brachionus plicatilis]